MITITVLVSLSTFSHLTFCFQIEHLRCMDVYEVAVNFADSTHGGDRRKKSQQCPLVFN
jgi:hypothetical protein